MPRIDTGPTRRAYRARDLSAACVLCSSFVAALVYAETRSVYASAVAAGGMLVIAIALMFSRQWEKSLQYGESMKTEPTAREIWLAFVIAGVRSKFGAAVLVAMLGAATWQFAIGSIEGGLIVLAIMVATYARIPAAVGAAIAVRVRDRGRGSGSK